MTPLWGTIRNLWLTHNRSEVLPRALCDTAICPSRGGIIQTMAANAQKSDRTRPAGVPESRWWFLVRPPVIYGTVIVSAVIVAAPDDDPDLQLVLLTLGTIGIVWVAHVFSEIVAGEHAVTNPPTPFRVVLAHAIGHGAGLLVAAILPVVCLLIGSLGGFTQSAAYYASLGVGVLTMGVLGWFVFAHRGHAWPIRLLGALGTALLGAGVVALNGIIH
jgi:hypothetical protein